MQKVLLAEGNC